MPVRVDPDIRGRVEALIAEHAWILDHGDPRDLPSVYAADGELLGLGDPLIGRQAIQGWADKRARLARVSRHVHTNLRLTLDADGRLSGTLITLLYRQDGAEVGPSWPFLVLDYADRYVEDADGEMRFASRSITRVFTDTTRKGA